MSTQSPETYTVSVIGLRQFSWVFIMDWVMVLVLSVFMLFHFNRLVGYILTLLVKSYMWHMHRVHVKIQSIQISMLGGRVLFKNISYIAQNETISVVQGSFTWRYWLFRTRLSDYHNKSEPLKNAKLPPRFSLRLEGVEWFVYNRSAAFDILESYINGEEPSETVRADPSEPSSTSAKQERTFFDSIRPFTDMMTNKDIPPTQTAPLSHAQHLLLASMPVQLRISKGAAIFGNRSTPSLMVFSFDSAKGLIDGGRAPNIYDEYKSIYQLKFDKPALELLPNLLYDENFSESSPAEKKISVLDWSEQDMVTRLLTKKTLSTPLRWIRWLRRKLKRDATTKPKEDSNSETDTFDSWHGLSRYRLNEDTDYELNEFFHETNSNLADLRDSKEYGKFSTVLDASSCSINFHYDNPGAIPDIQHPFIKDYSGADIGNNGSAPEWGLELKLNNSTIHYGPWADRQRVPLQRMINPRNFHNFKPARKRLPGELREYTEFKVLIELEGNTIIRVPTRENSKNNHFSSSGTTAAGSSTTNDIGGNKSGNSSKSARPFGWIELKTSDVATINYVQSMVPTAKDGWKSILEADLKEIEVRTSVNHELLFSASSHKFVADISNTLKWNELQTWLFQHESYNVKLFLVREHVMLLSDLTSDFTDGPSTPYDLFTPFIYKFGLNIHESYEFYLNVNDLNIINNPSDFEENTYIAFKGQELEIHNVIPLDQVCEKKNTVDFSIKVSIAKR